MLKYELWLIIVLANCLSVSCAFWSKTRSRGYLRISLSSSGCFRLSISSSHMLPHPEMFPRHNESQQPSQLTSLARRRTLDIRKPLLNSSRLISAHLVSVALLRDHYYATCFPITVTMTEGVRSHQLQACLLFISDESPRPRRTPSTSHSPHNMCR